MEPIDVAFKQFLQLRAEIESYRQTIKTETDTRFKVIDRFFVEVLGWGLGEVLTEDPAVDGFVDYNFRIEDRSRLIVEAKRDAKIFNIGRRDPSKGFKLNGPVLRPPEVKAGIAQAIRYCGSKNAELACLTNGTQWVVFRGNRLGDGVDTTEGVGFIFDSLDAVEKHFLLFYSMLSMEAVRAYEYRPYFQEAEGSPIRASNFQKALHATPRAMEASTLSRDIERVMNSFFRRLTGDQDPDMLLTCFVESRESESAEQSLSRVSEELLSRIRQLDTGDASLLSELISRATEAQRNEFVILVGSKGAGKSTFVRRFFAHVLRKDLTEKCVVLRVNLADSPGDSSGVLAWLQKSLLKEAEDTIFPEGLRFEDIKGVFFDEYTRLKKGSWAEKYEQNKSQFKIDFGERIEAWRDTNPQEYIRGLVRHIVTNRKLLPVLVFDNADHFGIDFQEAVYQYARSIYESELCLIILPITDRTSWQLARQGALQSFEHESLFLPSPPIRQIIKRRVQFIRNRLILERDRPDDRYFFRRGIYLDIKDLSAFADNLQRVFLDTPDVADWIGGFANHDVRRALHITRNLAASPHLKIDDLVKVHVSGSAFDVPPHRIAKALIRQRYDVYPVGQNEYVQNVFMMSDRIDTSPLLSLRVLQLLQDAASSGESSRFLDIEEVLRYFQATGIDTRAIKACLDALLGAALCLNYDPTIVTIEGATRVEISASGSLHLSWAKSSREYVSAMADVTVIRSEESFSAMKDALRHGPHSWLSKIAEFCSYLIREDSLYYRHLEHDSYIGQASLIKDFERLSAGCRREVSKIEGRSS